MKLLDILNELLLIPSDVSRLSTFGEEIIEEINEGPYTLILTRNKHYGTYQVGLTSDEQEFTTPSSQQKKSTDKSMSIILKVWMNLSKKIKEWSERYGKLIVGSFNRERTEKYRRILSNFGFKVGELISKSEGNYFFLDKKEPSYYPVG